MENKSYIDGFIITISKVPEKGFLTEEEVAWEIEELCRTVVGEGGGEGWISESRLVHILHDDIKISVNLKILELFVNVIFVSNNFIVTSNTSPS